MTAQMLKWIAAGVVAVATIPAVGFARSHRPVQAAPPSLMATSTDSASMTGSDITPAKPVALKSSKHKLHARKHSKLHSGKSRHKSLSTSKHKAHSLTAKHSKHKNLHSTSKQAAK